MNENGALIGKAMSADDPCPQTHFRCPHPVYCMPVFLRCNGVKDCPYGEDELSCEHMACPGYYRCRGSSVCLHPSYVCDGLPQCPERDDELLCKVTCPSACQCQGLAFVCHRPFPAMEHPDLRYVDSDGSGINPTELSGNHYLIYLSLAFCGITSWPRLHLQNLRHLDLSYNEVKSLTFIDMRPLHNLKFLSLKGNSLHRLWHIMQVENNVSVLVLDLSYTGLSQFGSTKLEHFYALERLNLSYNKIKTISEGGFDHLPTLKQVDLSGCDTEIIPRGVFVRLTNLQSVKAGNYKLCCKANLPETFNVNLCLFPQDKISSCQDLLRSSLHRAFVLAVSVLSIFGNVGYLLFSLRFKHTRSNSTYAVFMNNFTLSNFLMGVYLAVIGIADGIYRGEYLWHETTWKNSAICKVAGFISFVSSKQSVFMLFLITTDRFIALHFPFSEVRFKILSSRITSGLAWVLSLALSSVPLFPAFLHWRFHSQTGICIPLTTSLTHPQMQMYAFGVTAVFNVVMSVFIIIGQVFIYRAIKADVIEIYRSEKLYQEISIARRLTTVVVSDFLCWFPIGVLGLMAFNGTPVPGEVNVAMAIFVLPLNSALNPFLYTYNMLMERRRQAREARIISIFQAHAKKSVASGNPALRQARNQT